MEPNVARIMSSEELEIARLKAKANKLIDVNQQLVREKRSCRKPSSDYKEFQMQR